MAAGDTHVADQLDTVHHKMDSEVRGHHVYKSVWSPVIREQLILEKETYPCIHFLLDTNPWNTIKMLCMLDTHTHKVALLVCKHLDLYNLVLCT